ncbi:hypothetical protein HYE67_000437 [Fusarium culmorum]|uniref:Uncharacterized protein n=1 Tax=Fusarium culmorum TaxID=5516 RepID=A0A7S8CXN6_FUSCU|nr:hypothetical protein HYE67_000437 [Fusarium culmorum]
MFKLACKVSDVKELKYLNDEWDYKDDANYPAERKTNAQKSEVHNCARASDFELEHPVPIMAMFFSVVMKRDASRPR